MVQPKTENPIEAFIDRITNQVKRNPRLSMAVGALWLVNLCACLVIASGWVLWGWWDGQSARISAAPSPAPTTIVEQPQAELPGELVELPPTPECGPLTLSLGETSLRVEPLARADDGSIPVPPDIPGTAYQVEGSGLNDLFALSPTAENLGMVNSLQAGMGASLSSENCHTTLYTLSPLIPGAVDMATLEDQSAPGLVVFIPASEASPGLTLRGEPSKLILSGEATPAPDVTEVEASVSFLETSTSLLGSTIDVSVEIYNYGGQAFTLTAGDVALIQEGAEPLAPVAAQPDLPRELIPGERVAFVFAFPNPGGMEAVFKVFTVEFNLADFQ